MRSVNASWVTNAEPSALGNRFQFHLSSENWCESQAVDVIDLKPAYKLHICLGELCQAHCLNCHVWPCVVRSGRWLFGFVAWVYLLFF